SGRGADAGQRDPAAHGAARLQLLVAVLGAAVQPVLQLRGARQLRFLPARVVRALVRRQPPASSASRLLSRQLRVPVHLHGPPVPHAAAGRCRGGPAGARPGGEGRLSAASGPPARRPRALRHGRDAQSLACMAALPALAAWQWVHGVHALLYGLMLFLALGVGVTHHNHPHLRMWRRRWANRATDLALTVLQGHPTFVFFPAHAGNHHRHKHGARDLARTYRYGGDTNHLAGYLLHPFQAAWTLYPLFWRWLGRLRRHRPGAWR